MLYQLAETSILLSTHPSLDVSNALNINPETRLIYSPLIIRIGFCSIIIVLTRNPPPNSIGNYLGPYYAPKARKLTPPLQRKPPSPPPLFRLKKIPSVFDGLGI